MEDYSVPRQVLGNYNLIRPIGRGGFASVWECEHIHLGTKAAVKFLTNRLKDARLEESEIKGFLQEAKIIANLRHPNIIRLLDYSVQDSNPYLVMEYASGGNLAQRQAEGIPFTLPEVVSYVKQVAAALQYAHERGLVHRDVKPQNILLRETGELLLSDFGIAIMSSDSSDTNTDRLLSGTPRFMAPEQWLGKPRAASDQYALAICVYLWLCGTYPFQGNAVELMQRHLIEMPRLPQKINQAVPSEVGQVLLKALAKMPEDRFPTVADFARFLEQASLGQHVALPPSVQNVTPQMTGPIEISGHTDSSVFLSQDFGTTVLSHDTHPTALQKQTALSTASIGAQHTSVLLSLFTYLLVVPLLTLFMPVLLLYYYSNRVLHTIRKSADESTKQSSRITSLLAALPLPGGFWPAKLLTSKPRSPSTPLQSVQLEETQLLQRRDQQSVFWLKAAWTHVAAFVTKGPISLQNPVHREALPLTLRLSGNTRTGSSSLENDRWEQDRLAGHLDQENHSQKSHHTRPMMPSLRPPDGPEYVSSQASAHQERSHEQPDSWVAAGKRKNFCVLYHDNDRKWAEWIAWLLEDDGLSCIVPEWDFRPGYRIDKEVRNAINQAERIIVIVSPDYLDTRNAQWGIVFDKERVRREGTILPIIVRECSSPLKKPLDTLVPVNLVGRGGFYASEKLRKGVRLLRSKPTQSPPFPSPAQTIQDEKTPPESQAALKQQDGSTSESDSPHTPDAGVGPTVRFGKSISFSQIAVELESSFNQGVWPDVIRKARFLIQHSHPGEIPWQIYHMQAKSYHSLGQTAEARTARENALALISDKKERLALLDEYTNILFSLKLWQDTLLYTQEALMLAPDNIRWQALHEQITKRIEQEQFDEGGKQVFSRTAQEHATNPKEQLPAPEHMETMIIPDKAISIFIAYASSDANLCTDLRKQFTPLAYQHQLTVWYDHDISPGKERLKIIEQRLTSSRIIVLLVSASFLASGYHQHEMKLALEKYEAGITSVIPVLLRPSEWEKTSLGHFQPLPSNGQPITTWPNTDEALLSVVKGIRQVVEELQGGYRA